MPDLEYYRRLFPEKTDEERESIRRTLGGLARVVVQRYLEETKDKPAEVPCPSK